MLLFFEASLGVVDHLQCRLARFKSTTGRTRCGELCAHFLKALSKRLNLLLLAFLAIVSDDFALPKCGLLRHDLIRETR